MHEEGNKWEGKWDRLVKGWISEEDQSRKEGCDEVRRGKFVAENWNWEKENWDCYVNKRKRKNDQLALKVKTLRY